MGFFGVVCGMIDYIGREESRSKKKGQETETETETEEKEWNDGGSIDWIDLLIDFI